MKRKSTSTDEEDKNDEGEEKESINSANKRQKVEAKHEAEDREEKENKEDKTDATDDRILYVSIDFETTGTNIQNDEIIQVGLIKFDLETETIVEEYDTLLKPSKRIPDESQSVHGITDDDVADAPSFASIAPKIIDFIGSHALVGHNLLKFDLPLLQNELKRAKRPELNVRERLVLDTCVIFQKKEPHTLEKAALFYCDVEYDKEGAHNARNDAVACMRVLCGQKTKYKSLFDNMNDVQALCKPKEFYEIITHNNKQDVILLFGKHKDKKASDIRRTDKGYWTWLTNQEKTKKTKWYPILQSIC